MTPDTEVAGLRRANAELQQRLDDALAQQAATAEVLQVINSSPGNLAPVFDAMLEKAIRLCDSAFGILSTYDGECIHTPASRGTTPALADFLREPIRPRPGMALYRLVNGEDTVHVADITDLEAYRSGSPGPKGLADLGGARTILLVALRKDYRARVPPSRRLLPVLRQWRGSDSTKPGAPLRLSARAMSLRNKPPAPSRICSSANKNASTVIICHASRTRIRLSCARSFSLHCVNPAPGAPFPAVPRNFTKLYI